MGNAFKVHSKKDLSVGKFESLQSQKQSGQWVAENGVHVPPGVLLLQMVARLTKKFA